MHPFKGLDSRRLYLWAEGEWMTPQRLVAIMQGNRQKMFIATGMCTQLFKK